jgi:hypothetical protein
MQRLATLLAAGLLLAACSSSAHAGNPPATSGGRSPAPVATSAAAAGGSGKGEADANGWCAELAAAGKSVLSGGTPSKPLAESTLHRLVDTAPAAIRADVQRLGDVTLAAEQHKITQPPGDPKYLQAGEHVAIWLQANCPRLFQTLNPGYPTATG